MRLEVNIAKLRHRRERGFSVCAKMRNALAVVIQRREVDLSQRQSQPRPPKMQKEAAATKSNPEPVGLAGRMMSEVLEKTIQEQTGVNYNPRSFTGFGRTRSILRFSAPMRVLWFFRYAASGGRMGGIISAVPGGR